MFLKRLEIRGFKSFADKTELDFPNGITAVVGPNGSGKSNIADAVRWVLGEQSAKSLRGYKMEDIIFAGSDSRNPINYAEVTLILNNEQNILPIDYSEVAVTRKVYRSGESEYLINNQNCRLKDITELFMDTGLGKEAYSIIGQGRIEEILSTKSEERRGIFEEAAGIVKYKTRKKEAVKKLEETEANLVRVNDVMNELDDQIEPLKEASATAEVFLALKSELKNLDIALHAYQIKVIDEDWTQISSEKQSLEDELAKITTDLNTIEADFTELKWNLSKSEQQIEKLQQQFTEISTNLEKTVGDKNVLIERNNNIQYNSHNMTTEITGLRQLFETKSAAITNKQSDYENLNKQFKFKKEQLQAQLEQILAHETELELQDAQTENFKSDLIEILHIETTIKNNIHHLEQSINQATNKIIEYKNQSINTEQQINVLADEKSNITNKILATEQQLKELDEKSNDLLSKLQEEQKIIDNEVKNYQQKQQLLLSKQDRLQLLTDLENEYAGYYQGTKEVLVAKDNKLELLSGVRGAVVDLITTPKTYEIAIETALGSALQHIVVDNEQTAQNCIQYLKTRNKGRATFLPVSIIKGNSRKYHNCEDMDGFIGYAEELIETNAEYKDIISSLLGNIIIVKDMSTATKAASASMYKARIVTLDGDYISPGGSMTGGSNQRKGSALISRKNELVLLEHDINDLKRIIADKDAMLIKQQNHLKDKQMQMDEILASKEQLKQDYNNYQINLKQKEQEYDYKKNDLQIITQEENNYSLEKNIINEKIAAQNKELHELAIKQQEIEQKLQLHQDKLKQQVLAKDNANNQINEAKIQLVKYEEQLNTLNEIQQRDVQELEDIKAKLEKLITQEQQQQAQLQTIDVELERYQSQIDIQEQHKHNLSAEIDDNRIIRKRLQDQVAEQEIVVNEKTKHCKSIENKLHQLDVKINRYDVELNNALTQLQQEYEITYERAINEYPLQDDYELSKKNVNKLKQQIIALGDVNIGAIEEYKRVNERYHFLEVQSEDLQDAITKLYHVISEMNTEMEKRFLESFYLIKENFTEVFQEMFGGGRASLELTNPENVLLSGIEIYAEPPGKKLQHLSLLSGGERAFTAIALLFSILKVSPVPFCILDEVEAALDESNVNRFANYLRQYSDDTQFILVTHRKGTMEAADVLYGVTMEGSGVSKMISVKLEDAVKLKAAYEQIAAT